MYMAEVWQHATELQKNIHLHYSVEYANVKILLRSTAINVAVKWLAFLLLERCHVWFLVWGPTWLFWLVVFLSSMRQMFGARLKTVHIIPRNTALAKQFIKKETNHQHRHDTDVDNILNAYSNNLPYFSIDNGHLMYNAQPKLFWHSFWCIDNVHDAN
jgi:hypothetical protein